MAERYAERRDAGAANPTDRVLLLAALLASKNHQVSFVHGTLSDAEIAQVVALDVNGGTAPAPVPTGPGALPPAQQTAADATLTSDAKFADSIAATLASNGAPLGPSTAARSLSRA